jgi:hypothetical protein
MMCTSCMLKELGIFKIIIIYVIFLEFIDNKKLENYDGTDDVVYTLHV